MKIAQLKALAKRGESKNLEFKTSTANISAGMQTACAFLNSDHGGTVIFGVKDDGKVIGQIVNDKTRKEVAAELNKIEPHAKIDVKYVRVEGERFAIVLLVNPGDIAPYTYDGRPYMRNQSTTIRMPKEEYLYLYNKNNPELWESLTNNECTIKDLDLTRIKSVIRKAVFEKRMPEDAMESPIPDVLKKIKLMKDGKLTNAAVILFCKNEDKQFMQSNIKLARFKGTTRSEFLETKTIIGNAFDLYEKADSFLTFVLPLAARIEQGNPDRVETPAIPYSVLREAVINALAHRDYIRPGGSTSIAIYDDRVEISNSGSLPIGVKVSELTKVHESMPRNPLIANVFYLCRKIERWGRGTLDMIRDCQKAGNPPPKFEEIGGGFLVTLPFKEPIRSIIYEQAPKSDLSSLTDRQKAILKTLQQGPLKMTQIMGKLNIEIPNRTMQWELASLKKMGLIKSKGKTKAVIWSLVD